MSSCSVCHYNEQSKIVVHIKIDGRRLNLMVSQRGMLRDPSHRMDSTEEGEGDRIIQVL